MVNLTLLGCGGGMPIPERNLSALCIEYKGRKILVDCGEGTQVSMKISNLGFKSIDYICITHIHGDHIIGLPGILGTMGNSGRTESVTIIGPKGINEVIDGLMVLCKHLPFAVNVIEMENDKLNILDNEIIINTTEGYHGTNCIGYSFYFKRLPKFDKDKAIQNNVPKILWSKLQKQEDSIELEGKIYSKEMVLSGPRKGIKLSMITDSRPLDTMIDFIKYSDLFICEGTYGDDNDIEKAVRNKHMTFREAAILAKKSFCKQLLITHFSTAMQNPNEFIKNATDEFNNVIIGEDRLKLQLNFTE